jgi:hypothetical protein
MFEKGRWNRELFFEMMREIINLFLNLMNRVFSTMLRRRIESPAHQKIDWGVNISNEFTRNYVAVAYALRLWGRK